METLPAKTVQHALPETVNQLIMVASGLSSPGLAPVHSVNSDQALSFRTRGQTLDRSAELERFFAESERRAFRMAEIATGNRDEALDILQDAMFKLVEKYSDRDTKEWGPLFHTILQSRIKDWYRRNSVRNRFRTWFGSSTDDEDGYDPIQTAEDHDGRTPEQLVQTNQDMIVLEAAIRALTLRQQQAFMLRMFEGMNVAETARVMKCSEGSVKTHYSRAVHSLREQLGEF